MKKGKIWHKKWWIWVVVLFIVLSAFTPQILDWLYPKQGFWFTKTTFSKETLLLFHGNLLAFIGTVSLGGLALWQNRSFNKLSQNQNRLSIRPYLSTSIDDEDISFIAENEIGYFDLKVEKDNSIKCIGFKRNRPHDTSAYIKAKNEYEKLLSSPEIIAKKKIEFLDKQTSELSRLNSKYVLIRYALFNNGNAAAVKTDILLNSEKLTPLFSIDKSSNTVMYLFCNFEDVEIEQAVKFSFEILFHDIEDYGPYKQAETFYVTKKTDGQLSLNYQEQITPPKDINNKEEK